MLHDLLTRRGVREACTITLLTTMPKPIPISDEVSSAILALCDARGHRYSHSTWVDHLDPDKHEAVYRTAGACPSTCSSASPCTAPLE